MDPERSRRGAWVGRWEPAAVWLTWGGSLFLLLWYVRTFASNVPFWDDFDYLAPATEGRLFSPEWLWETQSNHRAPLSKAVVGALLLLSGNDFRVPQYFNALCLAAASFLFLRVLRRDRGGLRLTDAAVPLLLMHLGTGASVLRTLFVTVFVVVVAVLVAAFPRSGGTLDPRRLAALGWLLPLLLFTGSGGLALAAALVAWFAAGLALEMAHEGPSAALRRRGPAVVSFGIGASALGAAVLGIAGPMGDPAAVTAGSVLKVSLQVLGQAVGPGGAVGWTREGYGGVGVPLISLAVLAAFLAAIAVNAREAARRGSLLSPEGLRAFFLAGFLGIALVVGVGRAGLREDFGLQNHYAFLMAPGLAAVYAVLAPRRGWGGWRAFRFGFYSLTVALWVFNLQVGFREGKERLRRMREFEADVRAGLGDADLARRNCPFLYPYEEALAGNLSTMRRAGLHPFEKR